MRSLPELPYSSPRTPPQSRREDWNPIGRALAAHAVTVDGQQRRKAGHGMPQQTVSMSNATLQEEAKGFTWQQHGRLGSESALFLERDLRKQRAKS